VALRSVADGSECPAVIADGERLSREQRARLDPLFTAGRETKLAAFPVRVCQLQVPERKTAVLLEGGPLPLRE
jgi:hypothetical protein